MIYFWGHEYPVVYVMESRTPKKFVEIVKMHVLYMMYLIRVHAGKHLLIAFLFHNRLNRVLSQLVFSLTLTTCQ